MGVEVVYGKMESPVEIKVGDDWRRVLGVEIVLQDGIITDIR
ncbi:MAG: YlqD family protein [Desulfotomaculaceae bacterium]|nr:YlqD family protein [Desulfotomaculaceae bacterium]